MTPSEFSKLPLWRQAEILTELRAAVILATMGDDSLIRKMIGDNPPDVDPGAPLPDGAALADDVAAWLAGGAA